MKTPEQIAEDALATAGFPDDAAHGWIEWPRASTAAFIAAAIEADRAQHREQALSILATDDAVDQILDGMGIDWSVYEPNRDQVAQALAEMGLLVADSINAHREAHRAQRAPLEDWAHNVAALMAEDKSNDWGEEIAQLMVITGEAEGRIAELTAAWEESTGDTAAGYVLSEDDWRAGLDDEEAAEIVRLINGQEDGNAEAGQ